MKEHIYGPLTVGLLVVITLLVSSVVPGHAGSPGGHVFVGSHHFGGSRHFVGSRHVFVGNRHHFFGPRVFLGVGLAAPFWYPYPYPVYSPPVVVESSPPPTYVQQEAQPNQYWYYCQSSQAYYPYVKECPGGWLQVVPQTSPPPQ